MGRVINILESNIYYYITTLSMFHFCRNNQQPEKSVFFLRISSGDVNASVVTCQHPQIYNFSFREKFLQTFCKCIYLEF